MAKGATWAQQVLQLLLTNVAAAGIGDGPGLQPSASAGNLYLSLHTADPGSSGSQTTNETAYPGYARVVVPRAPSSWIIAAGSPATATLAGAASFPPCSGGSSDTLSYFAIGTQDTGGGEILYSGALTPPVAMGLGVLPQLTAATLIAED